MSDVDDIIKMLDSLSESGSSRIKIQVSDSLSEGEIKKDYHHGRCDVGSPFATGTLRNECF